MMCRSSELVPTVPAAQPQINRRSDCISEQEMVHANPLVSRVLTARGVESADELDFALKDLPPPHALLGIDVAVERLALALQEHQRIIIVGDYDCDGATSTTLALLALRSMGASDIDYLVPNRFEFGYGLSPEIVDVAAKHKPALIITVDNGVASVDGVERARELGIDVIVTDHHLPPAVLPRAVAIVNPNIPGATFPSKALAGVGVIFYVMLALRAYLKKTGWFEESKLVEPRLAELLDLVAIGTVADVVPLDRINRTLVEQGLRRIRAGKTRPGVRALMSISGRDPVVLAAVDIGFAIGPRLNAAGRLDDISIGIQCLLSASTDEAMQLAAELNALNIQRRVIEDEMRQEADIAVVQTLGQLEEKKIALMTLCLFEPHWHQGVIGILAGRLKEQLHVPVIVFASTEEGELKGSGRSIPGLHIRDALDTIATKNPGMIEKFGGHAMAAGLSIKQADLAEFKIAFDQAVSTTLNGVPSVREWVTDGVLSGSECTLENAALLRFVAPWGQNFPEPTFDGEFIVQSSRVLKDRHLKLKLVRPGSTDVVDAIAFNQVLELEPGQVARVVYRLDVNEFRSRRSLQLHVLWVGAV